MSGQALGRTEEVRASIKMKSGWMTKPHSVEADAFSLHSSGVKVLGRAVVLFA